MRYKDFETKLDSMIKYPDKVKETINWLYDKYPKEVSRAVHYAGLNNHLDEEMMCEALATITRYDSVKAPFWTMEDFRTICRKMNISCVSEKYNEFDLNFLTHYYFADFKSLGDKPETFIPMAVDKLHDVDDPKACEFAYREAKKRICEH